MQAQVLNLLQELKEKLHLTYFFISHNLNVVYQVSDRVGVMYLGKIVEIADYEKLYEKRYHPYTEALLSAIPQVGSDAGQRADPSDRRGAKPVQSAVRLPVPYPVPESMRPLLPGGPGASGSGERTFLSHAIFMEKEILPDHRRLNRTRSLPRRRREKKKRRN